MVCVGVSRSKCRAPSETDALARLLRDTIEADRYPLSPRVQMWKGILAKIRLKPLKASLAPKRLEPKPEQLTPQKHYKPLRSGREHRFFVAIIEHGDAGLLKRGRDCLNVLAVFTSK
jgi:hypothetical protein